MILQHPLLQTVTRWPGRRSTQLAFEALGFGLHKAWQQRVLDSCGEEKHLLDRYWDEVAVETMQSLGEGSPDQRAFVIQPAYRSAFLDELFAARDFVEPEYRYPPLLKCLFVRAKSSIVDAEFRDRERAFFGELQKAESRRLNISTEGWSDQKRDVIPFVEEFSRNLGFTRRRNRWRKRVGDDLVFEIGVDLGVLRTTPPLMFRFFHVQDPNFMFASTGVVVLNRLVPGLVEYSWYFEASDYILSVKAQIELFNIIATSFEESQG